MAFQKGHKVWNKGLKNIHLSLKSEFKKGHVMAEETKEKISKSLIGKKRFPLNKAHKRKLRQRKLGKVGSMHNSWKGEKASYTSKHQWIYKHYGKANKCENKDCNYPKKNTRGEIMEKPKRYEWANVSKQYKRSRMDYIQLCPNCHRLWDMKLVNLTAVFKPEIIEIHNEKDN